MVCLRHLVIVLVIAMASVTAPAIVCARIIRHSGSLLDVDPDAGTIVLAEIGPWRLDTNSTIITVRTILVTLDTHFVLARQVIEPDKRFAGDFTTEDIEPWAVSPGDVVTVDCVHRGGRSVAVRIVVVDAAVP